MDIERAFKFVFQEKNWLGKIVIGGLMVLFSIFIIPYLIYYGYLVELTHRTIRNEVELLPNWNNIIGKLGNGFKFMIVEFVYFIPGIILISIGAFLAGELRIEYREIRRVTLTLLPVGFEASEFGILFIISGIIYYVFLLLIMPFIVGRFAEDMNITAAFDISDIVAMFRSNIGNAIIVLLLVIAISIIASLGIALCFIGIFLTIVWANFVQFYLYGNLYAVARAQLKLNL
jgi:hypothetical protein